MKALTIKQPWAHLIVTGVKDVENRSWKPSDKMIGERIVIHSSKSFCKNEFFHANCILKDLMKPEIKREDVSFGSAIGTAVIDRIVVLSDSRWFFGDYGIIMRDVELYEIPVPCIGHLGFWEIGK